MNHIDDIMAMVIAGVITFGAVVVGSVVFALMINVIFGGF